MKAIEFVADACRSAHDEDDHQTYLVIALQAVVRSLIEHRVRISEMQVGGNHSPSIKIMSLVDIENLPSRSQVTSDPVEWAFKHAIHAIGKELNAIGSDEAMMAACNAVEEVSGTHGAVIVDHAFDGVGSWVA